MATTLKTIYPPQVDTFMPSFCYNESAKVWFNISSYSEDMINQIQFIHVSMVDQRNNVNVFAGTNSSNIITYPQYYPITFDGTKDNNNNPNNKMGYDSDKKMYWLTIPPQVIKTMPYYNVNQYYKIQLRFDLTLTNSNYSPYSNDYKDPTSFFYWNNDSDKKADALGLANYTNYNEDNFSEWSAGTLIKPILIPELKLNFKTNDTNFINKTTDEPLFGKLNFHEINDNENKICEEWLSWYQIKIIETISENRIITHFNSGKKYTNTTKNEINDIIDTSMLSVNNNYKIQLTYETNNGYTQIIEYPVQVKNYDNTTNIAYEKLIIDEENGIIAFKLNPLNSSGYLTIRRSSHHSNFSHWDLISTYNLSDLNGKSLIINDNTIESITGYRYQLQLYEINNNNVIMYSPQYIKDDDILHCDFYGALLSDEEKMLKITFDFQPSNRTNAINRSKTDTLGGQYPVFTQNSKLKYHTYNITGKISTEDNGELFLSKEEIFGDEYYNYRYNPNIALPHTSACKSIKSNNDWLYEREYRDAVEEWLNNGKPKLFRSMTEGNMIVMLDGISMTPDTVLGRRLYNFSATMYEIGNGKDLNSIASFGLCNIVTID